MTIWNQARRARSNQHVRVLSIQVKVCKSKQCETLEEESSFYFYFTICRGRNSRDRDILSLHCTDMENKDTQL